MPVFCAIAVMWYDARKGRSWPPPALAADDRPLAFRGTLEELPQDVLVGLITAFASPPLGTFKYGDEYFASWLTSSLFGLYELCALSASSRVLHAAIVHAGPTLWMRAAGLAPPKDFALNLDKDDERRFALGGIEACFSPAKHFPFVLSSFDSCRKAGTGSAARAAAEHALEQEATAALAILRRSSHHALEGLYRD